MIKFQGSIDIDRPVSEVFDFIADLTNGPKWQSGLTDSHVVTHGPMRVGTEFVEDIRFLGKHITARCHVTEFELGRRVRYEGTSNVMDFDGAFTFEPISTGTRLHMDWNTQVKGAWKLAEPIFSAEAKKESEGELRKLKEVVEAETRGEPQAEP